MIDSHVHTMHRVCRSGETNLQYTLMKMAIMSQGLIGQWAQILGDYVIIMCKGLMTVIMN